MHNDYFIDLFPACWNSRNIVNEARKRIDPNASTLDIMRDVAIENFPTPRLRVSKPIPADSTFYTNRNRSVDIIKKQVADRIMSLFPKMKASALSGYLRYSLTNGWKLRQVDKKLPGTDQIIKVWIGTKQFDSRDLKRIQEFTDALAEFKRTGIVTGKMSGNTLSDSVKMKVIERGDDWNEFVENELEKQIENALDVLVQKGKITTTSKEQFKKASPETQLKTLEAWDATPKITNTNFNNETAEKFIKADEAEAEEILKKWITITQPNTGPSMFAYIWLTKPELAQELVENAFKVNAERNAASIQAARQGNRDDLSDAEYEKAIKGTVDADIKSGRYERDVNISGDISDEDKKLAQQLYKALHNYDNKKDYSPEEIERATQRDIATDLRLHDLLNVDDDDIDWNADEDEEQAEGDEDNADSENIFDEDEEPINLNKAIELARRIDIEGYTAENKKWINQMWNHDAQKLGFKGVPDLMAQYRLYTKYNLGNKSSDSVIKGYNAPKGMDNKIHTKRYISTEEINRNPNYHHMRDEWGNPKPGYVDVYVDHMKEMDNKYNSNPELKIDRPRSLDDISLNSYELHDFKSIVTVLNIISQRGADGYKQEFIFEEPDESGELQILSDEPFRCMKSYNVNNRGEYRFVQMKKTMLPDEQIDNAVKFIRGKRIDYDAYNFDVSPHDIKSIWINHGEMVITAKYPISQHR